MPYIDDDLREGVDKEIVKLADVIEEACHQVNARDGVLNYTVCRLLTLLYPDESYFNYNRQVGVLECIKLELYRRRISKYEDIKIASNGDLPGWK